MFPKTLYTFFIIALFSFTVYSQDTIVKRDNSKIFSKIFEINEKNIKYTELRGKKEHRQKISKNDINVIVLRNGDVIKFNTTKKNNKLDSSLRISIKQIIPTTPKEYKIIEFNMIAGIVLNSSDCNIPYPPNENDKNSPTKITYFKTNNQVRIGEVIGFNLNMGKSPYIKHVVGVNFLKSSGEFNYLKTTVDPDSNIYYKKTSVDNFNIKSTDYYINLVNGFRVTIFKSFHIETLITINIATMHKSIVNGNRETHETGKQDVYRSIKDSIGHQSHVTEQSTFALSPKISYEFKKNNQKLGVFAGYNLNFNNKLSWLTIGLTYYPFKKLRS